jgi:hypothetical protein
MADAVARVTRSSLRQPHKNPSQHLPLGFSAQSYLYLSCNQDLNGTLFSLRDRPAGYRGFLATSVRCIGVIVGEVIFTGSNGGT